VPEITDALYVHFRAAVSDSLPASADAKPAIKFGDNLHVPDFNRHHGVEGRRANQSSFQSRWKPVPGIPDGSERFREPVAVPVSSHPGYLLGKRDMIRVARSTEHGNKLQIMVDPVNAPGDLNHVPSPDRPAALM
jgi:hypothetical protein